MPNGPACDPRLSALSEIPPPTPAARIPLYVNGSINARNGIGAIHLGAVSGSGTLNGGGCIAVGTDTWIMGKNTGSAFQGTIHNGTGGSASASAIRPAAMPGRFGVLALFRRR